MQSLILRPKPNARQIAALLAVWAGASGFDAADRSVNGTGETLKAGAFEVGVGSVAYGVADDVLVRLPTLSLLVGSGRAEVRYRSSLSARWRLSPYVALETPRHAGAGADLGWDLGDRKQHSLTAGLGVRYGPIAWPGQRKPKTWQDQALPRATFEYDYYHRGNVVYAGVFDALGYVGYTWAWDSFHAGLISSPASGFYPFPYVYWRL